MVKDSEKKAKVASGSGNLYELQCVKCKTVFDEAETVGSCLKCGNGLDVKYLKKSSDTAVKWSKENNHELALDFLKRAGLLPLVEKKYVTLGEGNTPLIRAKAVGKKYGFNNLYLKFEGANPTGVFKDRGSAVEIAKALELNAQAVTCASTGNMAASVAAYCAKAGLPCYVVIPEKTPMGKLAQAIAYGARVLKVRGDYGDCVRLSVEMAKHYNYYLAGDYAFRGEGQKSMAYELINQLDGKVPDWVIVPVGCGTNLSAIYKGFVELRALGLIEKMPKFIGVQPVNVPTIVDAWKQKLDHYVKVEHVSSVASAVGIGTPLDDVKVLDALYESNGYAEDATEAEILENQQLLGNIESLFVEPSAAIPVAVLPKLLAKGAVKPDDLVVGVLTGNGLKDPQSILTVMVDSPVLEPTIDELNRYFEMGMVAQKTSSQPAVLDDKGVSLWPQLPSKAKLQTEMKKIFGLKLTDDRAANLHDVLSSFTRKAKDIRKGDVEYALQMILKLPEGMEKKLQVKDFSVHATQHQSAEAWVALTFDGAHVASHAKGVGPVDGIINAIREAIKDKDTIGTKLTHYDVQINTSGTDAVVEVHLTLQGHNGTEVTGEAASPDVIVASINAFEHAYNLLNWKIKHS